MFAAFLHFEPDQAAAAVRADINVSHRVKVGLVESASLITRDGKTIREERTDWFGFLCNGSFEELEMLIRELGLLTATLAFYAQLQEWIERREVPPNRLTHEQAKNLQFRMGCVVAGAVFADGTIRLFPPFHIREAMGTDSTGGAD